MGQIKYSNLYIVTEYKKFHKHIKMKYSVVSIILSLISLVLGETCTSPTVSTDTYTSKNIALSTETAYVAEFTVGCQEDTKGFNLYAELEAGHLVPVAYVPESSSYQVSWAKDHKKAVTGAITLKMFNDEGYAAYRKAQRSEGDLSAVAPLFTVTINHPGASREGLFVQTEFIAVVTSLLVWWGANTMRSQIME